MSNQKSVQDKEPWLAVILSHIFPGIGQIYAGQTSRGLLLILIALFLIIFRRWLILSPTGSIRLGMLFLVGYCLLHLFNLFDAYRCTQKGNSREFERLRRGNKDPWRAVFLEKIFPGLGHAYQGQWDFAIRFLILLCMFLFGMGVLSEAAQVELPRVIPFSLGLFSSFFCSDHAYISSPTCREKSHHLILGICFTWLVLTLFTDFRSFLLKEFVFDTHCITPHDHKSVPPTIKVRDCVVEEKISYYFTNPKRGDIVVFRTTDEMNQNKWNRTDVLIKRIIGLPNEKAEVRDGLVYINNKAVNEKYLVAEANDKWDLEVIPDDTYLVFGSNRYRSLGGYSYDNHILVPRDLIIGKATKINWPPKRMGIIK